MARLDMAVPHRLRQDDALARIKQLLGEVKDQFADRISDLHEEWDGNTGQFNLVVMGYAVTGTLSVKSSTVKLAATLPFAASFFKGQIESAIRQRAESLLA